MAWGLFHMIAAHLLSSTSLILGWLIYLPLLCWAIWRAPWVELCSDLRRQHLLGGTALALFVLWLVRRDFDSGLSYHFIGMTAVTLLLDWPLAMLVGLIAQLGLLALGRQDLAALGVNGVLLVVIPVWVTEACALWVEKKQPHEGAAGLALLPVRIGLGHRLGCRLHDTGFGRGGRQEFSEHCIGIGSFLDGHRDRGSRFVYKLQAID